MITKVVEQWGEKTAETLINGTVRALLTQPCNGLFYPRVGDSRKTRKT